MRTRRDWPSPTVPDLDLPRRGGLPAAPAYPTASATSRSPLPLPEIELTPTTAPTKRCPVCTTELATDAWTCVGCGERFYADASPASLLPPPPGQWQAPLRAPAMLVRRGGGFMDSVAEILPMGIAKRLLAYSLFGVVVLNLFFACRVTLTTTLGGLVLALAGGIGVVANLSRED